VLAEYATFVPVFVAVTFAFGSTEPEGSVSVPVIVAVMVCALRLGMSRANNSGKVKKPLLMNLIRLLSYPQDSGQLRSITTR
jgi:hypothetical protein